MFKKYFHGLKWNLQFVSINVCFRNMRNVFKKFSPWSVSKYVNLYTGINVYMYSLRRQSALCNPDIYNFPPYTCITSAAQCIWCHSFENLSLCWYFSKSVRKLYYVLSLSQFPVVFPLFVNHMFMHDVLSLLFWDKFQVYCNSH